MKYTVGTSHADTPKQINNSKGNLYINFMIKSYVICMCRIYCLCFDCQLKIQVCYR